MEQIKWHRTYVGEEEAARIREALLNGCVSMGRVTEEFEGCLANSFKVPYCVVTPSGSVAIFMALKALEIGAGDEVIVPNRGWVAAAHAIHLAGAIVVLADVRRDIPIIDVDDIRRVITPKTKAIIPLQLNGRSADMPELLKLAKSHHVAVVEDACQAMLSRNEGGMIGTQGKMGCFSLGMAKLVATGQGGFVVTRDEGLFKALRSIRNHGVTDNFTDAWYRWGFNFKFTDIQAAMGIVQLERAPQRIEHLKAIYDAYEKGLKSIPGVRLIPVKVPQGEVPLYIEVLADRRKELVQCLAERGIQARLATPDLNPTPYFKSEGEYPNSRIFSSRGLYLPGGPEQPLDNVQKVLRALEDFYS